MPSFVGFVLPPKKNESDSESGCESDSDGDFEDHDFQDMHKIAGEELSCSSSIKLRYVVKRLQELSPANSDCVASVTNERRVRGQFDPLFSYPWWKVEIQTDAKKSKTILHASSRPSYSYRTDDAVEEGILSLFLVKGCGVESRHAKELIDFIKRNKFRLTLLDMPENLKTFTNSGKEGSEIAEQIKKCLESSATGKAYHVPNLTKYAHRLFPYQACSLWDIGLPSLCRMNEALDLEPWVFGFKKVLKNQFRISGIEAKLSAFIECDLLNRMPVDKQDALFIYNALSEITRRFGHTYILLRELKQPKYYEKPYSPKSYDVTQWERGLEYLMQIQVVGIEGHISDDRCHVFLTHLRHYEKNIAKHLSTIVMNQGSWIGHIDVKEEVFHGDQDQVKAAKLLTTKPVVVMSGRGGCGKTFVVSTMLKMKAGYFLADSSAGEEIDLSLLPEDTEFPDDQETCPVPTSSSGIEDEVLLTAPTGKAAAVLSRRSEIPAFTLHSVIFSFFSWLKGKKEKDESQIKEIGAWKFSDVRLVVCDECSLISVKLFATLIDILRTNSKLQQVILLGDTDQLPSIEPGNFLSDVYDALKPHGASINLRTNHRTDSEHIVQNAMKISHRHMPLFTNSDGGFVSLEYSSKQTDEDSNTIAEKVRTLLKKTELPEPKESQFVAFRNKDCTLINEICAVHYNHHSIKNAKEKFDFQIGDKVCLRRNTVCFDENKKEEVKLCNGEIFFIKDIIEVQQESSRTKETFFVLDDEERTMKINKRMLKKLRHAWARTIHTFQGSEINTLVYVVGNPFYQNWQHVYTAVTRGIKKVIIINDPTNLEKAIKYSPIPRKTKLRDDLSQAFGNGFSPASTKTPMSSSFPISRRNLGKRSMQAAHEDMMDASCSSTEESVSELHNVLSSATQQAVSATSFHEQTSFMSPQKRKLLESSPFLSPPETPKPLKHLKESLSAVSPLNKSLSEHASASNQARTTPSKRSSCSAKHRGRCDVCNGDINEGDNIVPVDDLSGRRGYKTTWVHESCARK